jgi:hypothetical protein
MKKVVFLLIVMVLIISSCKEDPTEPSSSSHLFQGIIVTDDVGNALGTYGKDDGDWGKDMNWTNAENQLLDFADTVSLDATFLGDTTVHPYIMTAFFPNPTSSSSMVYLKIPGTLKFKMTIVDKNFKRLFTFCKKLPQGMYSFEMEFSDTTKFVNKELYRMYYQYSYSGNINYYKGHGDIMICRSSSQFDCIHW